MILLLPFLRIETAQVSDVDLEVELSLGDLFGRAGIRQRLAESIAKAAEVLLEVWTSALDA